MIFTVGEQSRQLVAYTQSNEKKCIYTVIFVRNPFELVLRLHKSYRNDWSAFVSDRNLTDTFDRKLHIVHKLRLKHQRKRY